MNHIFSVIMLTANVINGMKETYKKADEDVPENKLVEDYEMEWIELAQLKTEFPDIDFEKGLKYCSGSKEFYIELLKDFAIPSRKEELQTAYNDRAWALYAAKVHALKGSARMFGITEIENITEGLQKAAEKLRESEDAEALRYMEENHDKAMELFDTLVECVKGL